MHTAGRLTKNHGCETRLVYFSGVASAAVLWMAACAVCVFGIRHCSVRSVAAEDLLLGVKK